jgi:anti-sigma regulatory factor (Ser/Thr protein kinase)
MARIDTAPDGDSSQDRALRDAEAVPARAPRGVAALRAENRQLRLELSELRASAPGNGNGDAPAAPAGGPPQAGPHSDLTQIVLPADRKAPGAARALLGLCLGSLLGARMLDDAQLLVSEVVTNSIVHGALGDGASIVVRVHLAADALRLEVHNPGITGTIAAGGGDLEGGRGFGLELVSLLSTRWGVRRDVDTCVWVEMARA